LLKAERKRLKQTGAHLAYVSYAAWLTNILRQKNIEAHMTFKSSHAYVEAKSGEKDFYCDSFPEGACLEGLAVEEVVVLSINEPKAEFYRGGFRFEEDEYKRFLFRAVCIIQNSEFSAFRSFFENGKNDEISSPLLDPASSPLLNSASSAEAEVRSYIDQAWRALTDQDADKLEKALEELEMRHGFIIERCSGDFNNCPEKRWLGSNFADLISTFNIYPLFDKIGLGFRTRNFIEFANTRYHLEDNINQHVHASYGVILSRAIYGKKGKGIEYVAIDGGSGIKKNEVDLCLTWKCGSDSQSINLGEGLPRFMGMMHEARMDFSSATFIIPTLN
jgi:hypothetical protein